MKKRTSSESTKSVRCAIYTRKSTEEGLEQEFNSLDAQRESAEAFIVSQRHEGWEAVAESYDDGGFTGGNMERPALKRLLVDIKAGKIDCVIVYKVDRLSRSLMDFARIIEIFDSQHISFVSVTQQFNTATSMGRLVLNVLLSFAQFEREMISERVRDKVAALAVVESGQVACRFWATPLKTPSLWSTKSRLPQCVKSSNCIWSINHFCQRYASSIDVAGRPNAG